MVIIMKRIINIIIRFFTNKAYRIVVFDRLGIYGKITDRKYLEKFYKAKTGKRLNLDNPKTFNEKIQWCKLYDHKTGYNKMVDKCDVKDYVADKIGIEYIIPTIGVWQNFDEIDFSSLPQQFVLKCTHDSGGLIICRDKSKLDLSSAKKRIEISLSHNFYKRGREWVYKDLKPRIIAEEYMQDGETECLPVFKFFCFSSQPKIIQVIQNDKTEKETIDYFDTQWNRLDLRQNFPNSENPLDKPEQLAEMVALAHKLSEDKKGFLRVDFYVVNGKIYFSEYTFYSDDGMAKFHPEEWDSILGDWFELPDKTEE